MATLSFEEFAKKAGGSIKDTKLVSSAEIPTQAKQPGYLERVKQEAFGGGEQIVKSVTRGSELMGQPDSGITGGATGVAVSGLGSAAGAARTLFSPLTAAISPLIEKGLKASGVADNATVQQKLASFDEWAKAHPDVADILKSTLEVGGTITGTKGITRALPIIEKGALKTAEKGLETVPIIGKGTSRGGEKLYKTAFDLTADEARLVQGNKINIAFLEKERTKLPKTSEEYKTLTAQIEANKLPVTRATTALEKGIAGTEKQVGVKAGVEKMDIWKNKLEPALKASKDVITKDELFAKARERVASELEPSRQASMKAALESLEQDYKGFTTKDLLSANKIKTSLDTFTPSKIFKGQEVASELKTLKADMANAIRQKTYMSLKDINAKRAYIDYGNLKQLEKVGIKALTEAGTKGGFGGFWSTVYDMATVPVKTIGGKVLYRVGNKLEFLGEKGVKTLRQHLESKGIKIKKP